MRSGDLLINHINWWPGLPELTNTVDRSTSSDSKINISGIAAFMSPFFTFSSSVLVKASPAA